MRRTATWISSALLLGGCIQDLLAEGTALAPDTEAGTSSTSTSEPPTPTTSVGPGVNTVTGVDESTETSAGAEGSSTSSEPASSSGEAVNEPPTVDLTVMPDHLGEAGPAELHLVASDDVVTVRLSIDGEKIADLTPADFPYVWEALSAKDNGPARTFSVVVSDEEGLMADDDASLDVQLPPPGAERCLFEDPERGAVTSIITAIEYTPDAIVAVGARGTGVLRLAVWKLDPDNCDPLPDWPKTFVNWTAHDELGGLMSLGSAVDVDADGNILVGSNFIVNGSTRGYAALLNEGGSRLWEQPGQLGDEVMGVAASTGSYSNRFFVVGSRRTSDNPVRTDAAIWMHHVTDGDVYVQPATLLRAPFTPDEFDQDETNVRSEWARAVVVDTAGNALVVGERELKDELLKPYSRAFAVRVHPFGEVIGVPWTSWAPAYLNDAARAVSFCGDDILASGWTLDSEDPNAKPEPFMFWLETQTHRHLPQLGATQIFGIACDREEKIVSAATRSSVPSDAQIFSVLGTSDTPVWYEQGVAGADGAGAVACDHRGFCGWGGYRTANNLPYAVVRVHHP